jgi:hypothetical protein
MEARDEESLARRVTHDHDPEAVIAINAGESSCHREDGPNRLVVTDNALGTKP